MIVFARALVLAMRAYAVAAVAFAADKPLTEGDCMFVTEIAGKPTPSAWVKIPVLNGPDKLPITIVDGGKLDTIACERSDIVPDARDDRVVLQFPGTTFSIGAGDALGELKFDGTSFSYTNVTGPPWTSEQEARIVERIGLFNSRLKPNKAQ